MTLLIVLLILAVAGGGWGYNQYGPAGFGPLGLVVAVILILYLMGHL